MSLVPVFVVESLLFTDNFYSFSNNYNGPSDDILHSTFVKFLHFDFCFVISFQPPFALHSYPLVLLYPAISKFYLSCFWLLCVAYWPEPLHLLVTPSFHFTVTFACSHTALGMYQYQFHAVLMPNFLHIL